MRSTIEPVEKNVVRLSVQVDEAEVEDILTENYRQLSRSARIPGFRPGKVPRKVLEARLGGAQALRAEALREALPDLYGRAVVEAELDPIDRPEIDITAGTDSGALSFDAVVQVRPIVSIPGYGGLKVEVPALAATDQDVDRQIDRLRETEAELVEVGRPAAAGDHLTIDLHGTDAAGQQVVDSDDYLYELGSATVGPELDAVLVGARPGDLLTTDTPIGDGTSTVTLRVLVKEVKEKVLPAVTDEWVAQSSEFSTVDDLRADLTRRLGEVKRRQAQMVLRQGTLRALSDLVDDDEVPAVLVDAEVRQALHNLEHRLAEQRVTLDQFMATTGRTPDDLVASMRDEAVLEVKADLALLALAEAEAIAVTDDEVEAEIVAMAGQAGVDAAALRLRLEHENRMAAVRSEQRKRKAVQWLLDHVEIVDDDGNAVTVAELQDDQGATDVVDESDSGQADQAGSAAVGAGDEATGDDASSGVVTTDVEESV
jgi:trigger factor